MTRVKAELFIDIWQTSYSVDEVIERLGGANRSTVIKRACRYRARGVPLKRMWGTANPHHLNWNELKKQAKEKP